ncbi:uncharacterized protein [Argopecten irradians]|uniref:uncharacterized protein n=1 Tax=Argopecten irradians TaxID=31199 RepID=UPI00371C6CE6
MDILRARRQQLMGSNEFSPATRKPVQYYKTSPLDIKNLPKPSLSTPRNTGNQCVGRNTSFIKTNLTRIGRSLEHLQSNFEEEQSVISREFERKLTQVSTSIGASINNIRDRLTALTSLLGGNDVSQDSGLTDSISKSENDLDQTDDGSSPFQSFSQHTPYSPSIKSESLDHFNVQKIPESNTVFNFAVKTGRDLRSTSLDHINACVDINNQSRQRHSPHVHESVKSNDSGIGGSEYNQTESSNTAYRTIAGVDYPYGQRRQWRPMKSTNYLELLKKGYCNWVPKSMSSISSSTCDVTSKEPGSVQKGPKDFGYQPHNNTGRFKVMNMTSVITNQATTGNDDGDRKDKTEDSSNRDNGDVMIPHVSDDVIPATAMEWRSHNRHNPTDYTELSTLKVEPPATRYPPWLFPEFYSNRYKDEEYPDVFEDENGGNKEDASSRIGESYHEPRQQWQWGVSRSLWQGWTLPGLSEEVERQLVSRLQENRVFRRQLIDAHNALRGCHGSPKLAEVDDLTRDAQMWADIIAEKGFTQYSELPGRGESIVLLDTNGLELDGGDVSKLWYNERDQFDFSDPKWRKATMNFTQMIWKSSTDVGVGVAKVKDKDKCVVVAQYRPVGNGNRPGEFRKNVPASL